MLCSLIPARGSKPALLFSAITALFHTSLAQDGCVTHSSANPHALDYPNFISGNLNGTTLIVPIPLTTARDVIPSQYGIMEHAYRALLPTFPEGMYPMMAVGVHDHDLQFPAYGMHLADFSRAALEFPFLDILGDNYSSFRWAATMLITAGNEVAITGSEGFGITVYPGVFDPPCNAYGHADGGASSDGATYFHAASHEVALDRFVDLEMAPAADGDPYGLEFLKNITNQPVFANPSICDNYQRLFNTSLTLPPNEPVPVRGSVRALIEPFQVAQSWEDVFGWQLSTGFLEPPVGDSCESLKGYNGAAAVLRPPQQLPRECPFAGIVKTNALSCGSGAIAGGVYPTICRINHSCRPSCYNNWNEDLELETIHAIKDIGAGEEITIDYSDGGPFDTRRINLQQSFGFDCDCVVCSLPPAELKASDDRRRRIQALDEAIGNSYRMMSDPVASLADCCALLRALEEEYPIPRARKVFAERAYKARVVMKGGDRPETKKVKALSLNPSSHPSFGTYSTKWKGPKKLNPEELNDAELEKWLWRQNR
ncbi:hypothetical protein DL762_009221 [Monosporascus cannonballus]|uniref:SET domain-containing protein n=1 Tax=Monosporascus cannonballus TaxID=155416 RepID=A0ABY0GTZ0_9PEZI|nr:hypothetical protein DL762_009221 [Monosporascus cannonballus]